MSEIPFHATVRGARFYDHTVPELVRQLERLNANLERWNHLQSKETNDGEGHQEDREARPTHPRGDDR